MASELPLFDDAAVLALRPPHAPPLEVTRPHAAFVEPERTRRSLVEDVATLLLVNRECPFRCVMCDLWKYTTAEKVPDGAVAAQVASGLASLPPTRHVKLYNAGNFFDARAVPSHDLPLIAGRVKDHETVIVECHPSLVGPRVAEFARRLSGALDVAMGLETIDPAVLPRLNKRMTLDGFRRAVDYCRDKGMHVRAFIIVRLPGQSEEEGRHWALASVEWAFDAGVECCAVIPARAGNGTMEELSRLGLFTPPSLESLEWVLTQSVRLGRGRVFADTWNLDPATAARLRRINHEQAVPS